MNRILAAAQSQKGVAPIAQIVVLFLMIGLGVFLVQQRTNLFPKAIVAPREETSFNLVAAFDSGAVKVGDKLQVDVVVRSDVEAANAFDAKLLFNPDVLEVTGIVTTPSTEEWPKPKPIPGGCSYQEVRCVRAPCESILVCPNPSVGPHPSDRVCAQVITQACRNRSTCTPGGACTEIGPECREFPTPCDVPDGWYIDNGRGSTANETIANEAIACPADAKQCPDGSWVSRTAPGCQFAACPGQPKPTDPGILCGGNSPNNCPEGMVCQYESTQSAATWGTCVPIKKAPAPPNNYFIQTWIENTYVNEKGSISLVGGVPTPGIKTNPSYNGNIMVSIFFMAKKEGEAAINFTEDSAIYSNATNQNILTEKRNLSFTVHPGNAPPKRKGDLNNDGKVNILDISILIGKWAGNDIEADLNGDGRVNIPDLSVLLSNWGG